MENEKYFLVVYCNDGTTHLWEGESKEDCLDKLRDMLTYANVRKVYKEATIIKRDMSNYKEGYLFGHYDYITKMANKILAQYEQN